MSMNKNKYLMLFLSVFVILFATCPSTSAALKAHDVIRNMEKENDEQYLKIRDIVDRCRGLVTELEELNDKLEGQIIDRIIDERRCAEDLYDKKSQLQRELIRDEFGTRELSDEDKYRIDRELLSVEEGIRNCIERIHGQILITDSLLEEVYKRVAERIRRKRAFVEDIVSVITGE
jgi:hypothetical protein